MNKYRYLWQPIESLRHAVRYWIDNDEVPSLYECQDGKWKKKSGTIWIVIGYYTATTVFHPPFADFDELFGLYRFSDISLDKKFDTLNIQYILRVSSSTSLVKCILSMWFCLFILISYAYDNLFSSSHNINRTRSFELHLLFVSFKFAEPPPVV